jgi:hypothetical protein
MLKTKQSPREVVISEDLMQMSWDYTFLGHYHERAWVSSSDGKTDTAKRKQFYNGSLLRRGFNDKVSDLGRGWTKWEINEKTKQFTPEFFYVAERPQFDCPPINCEGLRASQIETKIVSQLNQINKKMKFDVEREVIDSEYPIVRQTLVGVTPMLNLVVNWQNFSQYYRNYFSHTFKKVASSVKETLSGENKDFDVQTNKSITQQFNDWVQLANNASIKNIDRKIRKPVLEKSEGLLREAMSEIKFQKNKEE